MHDLVIRAGTVVDGTGAPAVTADVAVDGGVITAVGRVEDRGREEIDADGLLVTPGFVDVHTHYDAQVTWDPLLSPSCWHGVTTAILGNCGVGFAPVRPERREWLVRLMEAVEDIPGSALHAGIPWSWESFPEYLDALDGLPHAIDVAAQVPHGSLRAYVMDERGADNEPATADDIGRMAALVEEAVRAGAIGLSTNRLPAHRARDGRPVPGTYAAEDELFALGRAMAAGGSGVLEIVSGGSQGMIEGGFRADIDWSGRLSRETGIAVTICLSQVNQQPDHWREVLGWIDEARAGGARITPQVAGRPLGMLLGLQTKHQFQGRLSYDEVAGLGLADRARALADPERRRRILAEPVPQAGVGRFAAAMAHLAFVLDGAVAGLPDYEPEAGRSVAALAAASGRSTEETFYDLYLGEEGRRLLLFAFGGYANGDCDHIREMLSHP
jgi:N-acyl-D-amino-acid deacylase